jgi:hypothetical protein
MPHQIHLWQKVLWPFPMPISPGPASWGLIPRRRMVRRLHAPPFAQQIRNALQVGFAGFLAAGIHAAAGPDVNAVDGFHVVYGAARSLLPTPEASREAAWARMVGTVFGGAVVVLLTQALHNWLAIGIGYVLIQLLGRRLGLSPATLMDAVIMTVLILAVPAHERMGGWYVVDRTGWHLLGLLLGMAVERLFWFRSPLERLQDSERGLLGRIDALLAGLSHDGAVLRAQQQLQHGSTVMSAALPTADPPPQDARNQLLIVSRLLLLSDALIRLPGSPQRPGPLDAGR